VAYGRYADQKFTCGTLIGVVLNKTTSSFVTAAPAIAETEKPIQFDLAADYVGACLISNCLTKRIPVPQNVTRYLLKSNVGVSLCFAMGEGIENGGIDLPPYFEFDDRRPAVRSA
jgi:hypothetical protein